MAQSSGDAPKRIRKFFKSASIEKTPDGFSLLLDGKAARTPARAAFTLPNAALAEAVAEEWRVDGETLFLAKMPLTRLASTALDLGGSDRAKWTGEIFNYLGTDLLCYRAEEPAALVARQAAAWNPLLDWAEETFGARPAVTAGVAAIEQPEEMLIAARRRLEAMDIWRLAGLFAAVPIAGSAVIGIALAARAFQAATLFAASRVDELYQAERWGRDAEAAARERFLEAEFLAADKWFGLL
jgi:chaperone required for assembly of F1-ATPase